ncbi:MAG: hypothetical protein U0T69_03480 [Chitinophagales bacterium]
MHFFRTFLLIVLIINLSHCTKETQPSECINIQQKNAFLQSLEYLSNDSVQVTSAERKLLNEIRIIANDVDILSSSIDTTLPVQGYYNLVKANFLQHADLVTQKASLFYNGSEAKVILAKNAFVLMSYDALQRKYPEFMWTQLGIFAANEVRSGLVMALSLRDLLIRNNIHIPFGTTDVSAAMLESSQILIQGQVDVLTDIGSLGILNHNRGAANIKNENWLTAEAREGFRLQEQAESALKAGNCTEFMDIQTAAAIQFGAHEQIYILQPMWDKPMMQQFANLDKVMIQMTGHKFVFFGDIFVGTNKTLEANKGYIIHIPANVNNLANATQRVQVAMNGFNTLNSLRKNNSSKKWIDYSQVKIGYFYDVYNADGIVW